MSGVGSPDRTDGALTRADVAAQPEALGAR
jgi:hypothetical protein